MIDKVARFEETEKNLVWGKKFYDSHLRQGIKVEPRDIDTWLFSDTSAQAKNLNWSATEKHQELRQLLTEIINGSYSLEQMRSDFLSAATNILQR
jgi:hypothetical protein